MPIQAATSASVSASAASNAVTAPIEWAQVFTSFPVVVTTIAAGFAAVLTVFSILKTRGELSLLAQQREKLRLELEKLRSEIDALQKNQAAEATPPSVIQLPTVQEVERYGVISAAYEATAREFPRYRELPTTLEELTENVHGITAAGHMPRQHRMDLLTFRFAVFATAVAPALLLFSALQAGLPGEVGSSSHRLFAVLWLEAAVGFFSVSMYWDRHARRTKGGALHEELKALKQFVEFGQDFIARNGKPVQKLD